MEGTERESIQYQCEKLKGIAHANVEYFYWEEGKFILGFQCDQSVDCGIIRSPFSNNPIYSLDCPLYIDLENKLN